MYINTNIMAVVRQVEQTKDDRPWIYNDDLNQEMQTESLVVDHQPERKLQLRQVFAVVLSILQK